jgi:hypothetical protein
MPVKRLEYFLAKGRARLCRLGTTDRSTKVGKQLIEEIWGTPYI